jgi:membrane protease YdiL (CAAX protease family)
MPGWYEWALAVGGVIAAAVAWVTVRTRRASIWTAMGVTLIPLGALILLTGSVPAATAVSVPAAALLGLAGGGSLYGATAAFMWAARQWPTLARQTSSFYRQADDLSVAAGVGVSALVGVGEELLWRGMVAGVLVETSGSAACGAAQAWAVNVVTYLLSGSVPVVLGALVGGGTWAFLGWWTGGVVAPALCHVVWTSLMIAAPPAASRR